MSKAIAGGLPWSVWKWGLTPEATEPRPTVTRTAKRAHRSALLVLLLSAACSRTSPQAEYDRLQALYLRGQLETTAAEASALAGRYPDPNSPWRWRFRLLQSEALTALARNKEADDLLGEPIPGKALEQLEARRLIDLAILRQGKTAEANGYLEKARAIARDPEMQIRLHVAQGQVQARARDFPGADREWQAGLDAATRFGRKDYQAISLNNLCYSRKNLFRYEDAIEYGVRAVALAESIGALRTAAMAHTNLGPVYAFLGDFPSAYQHQQKAVDGMRSMKAKASLMTALGELGLTYDRDGQGDKAIRNYQEAYNLATELKRDADAARFAENTSLTFGKMKQWDRAAEWNERAAALGGGALNQLYVQQNRGEIAQGRGDLAGAARIWRELIEAKDAPPAMQWHAWERLAETDFAAKRYARANQEYARALQIIESTREDLGNAQNRVTLIGRLIGFYQEYVDALVAQNEDARAIQTVESSRARVLAERLGRDFRPERFSGPRQLTEFARTANTALLSFWIAPKRSFAWLIDRKGVRRFELPPSQEVESLVTAYREVVEHSIADPLTDPAGRALWDKLLAPIGSVPKDTRLIVIPDGPLHRLNLETVVVPTPAPHYWIEDVEMAVAPSITLAMSKTDGTKGDGRLLAIGAPDYSGSQYQALPGAAEEVRRLQSRFPGAAVLTGAQASPAAYRNAGPEKFSLIHFAAHAEANEERPLESAVVLSRSPEGYMLRAREVIGVPIHADVVTLSACKGAGARAYRGEGLMGFAWAFLRAGAKAVVAGLWNVSDDASAPLMAKFYDGIAARRTVACALRDAKLAMLREGKYRKAFYWGALQTYLASGY